MSLKREHRSIEREERILAQNYQFRIRKKGLIGYKEFRGARDQFAPPPYIRICTGHDIVAVAVSYVNTTQID